ncbi:EutN/CcmL family microcompartment protein [Gordonia sp. TBRC 11910]|uniref:EutN/CcmL family microcompartment protein n=1 Tax=Gordonia asplenii TaxID=2725283 RepID=A0A848L3Z5_9ACTN|nr:EutN/CcmL family microcompartment protein [Gordonia asplenii]NMO03775.1 EutN/CcmL family microcompartment protein [Gordonia asplenii]
MRVARVVGQVVSTAKPASIAGRTILLVHDLDPAAPERVVGTPYAVVDLVGAGRGEVVLVAAGSAARVDEELASAPVDAAVIGIIDSLIVENEVTYDK